MTKLIQEKCTSLSIKTQKTKSIKDKIQVKTQIPATEKRNLKLVLQDHVH